VRWSGMSEINWDALERAIKQSDSRMTVTALDEAPPPSEAPASPATMRKRASVTSTLRSMLTRRSESGGPCATLRRSSSGTSSSPDSLAASPPRRMSAGSNAMADDLSSVAVAAEGPGPDKFSTVSRSLLERIAQQSGHIRGAALASPRAEVKRSGEGHGEEHVSLEAWVEQVRSELPL
jgi:hypothetical protein